MAFLIIIIVAVGTIYKTLNFIFGNYKIEENEKLF